MPMPTSERWPTYRLKSKPRCPTCRELLDAATNLHSFGVPDMRPGPPRPGTLSVCMYCGTILQLTRAMQFVIVADKDFAKLPDPVQRAMRATQSSSMFAERLRRGLGLGPVTLPCELCAKGATVVFASSVGVVLTTLRREGWVLRASREAADRVVFFCDQCTTKAVH